MHQDYYQKIIIKIILRLRILEKNSFHILKKKKKQVKIFKKIITYFNKNQKIKIKKIKNFRKKIT